MTIRILITGACGFVGSSIAESLVRESNQPKLEIIGVDNFSRAGAAENVRHLSGLGVRVQHADVRLQSDLDTLPACEWVIDASANASVLAGLDAKSSSRRLVENNLQGTTNLLECCRRWQSGFILLSTSRVYSIKPLANLYSAMGEDGFELPADEPLPRGVSKYGIAESFDADPPLSLYGATKRASEIMAIEFGYAFDIPVWVNRCGVLAGARQFGRADQGIFSFWLNRWKNNLPLRYIGFGGRGIQMRDCLHPSDLARLLEKQMEARYDRDKPVVVNVSGGIESTMSLKDLSEWCERRWGPRKIEMHAESRPYDLPWVVLDSRLANRVWSWNPSMSTHLILSEIAEHCDENSDWLERSNQY